MRPSAPSARAPPPLLAAAPASLRPARRRRRCARLAEAGGARRPSLLALGCTRAARRAGLATSAWSASASIAFSVRLDAVSATMLLLVTFIGWVVLRYRATLSRRRGAAGHVHRLAVHDACRRAAAGDFRQSRACSCWPGSRPACACTSCCCSIPSASARGARRARSSSPRGSATLRSLAAAVLLVFAYGTSDIGAILDAARQGAGGGLALAAAAMLALAALLKSAQFPTHGWLTEVMETPTPVSALLHAGVINAGGFLLIRFADVMLLAPGVLAVLVMVGGFTALFGGLVMLTQPAVKTSLAWSTVAQMGFMILRMRAGAVPAGAPAHRRPFALQGACLPRLRRRGRAGRGDPAAGSGRHSRAVAVGRPSCWRWRSTPWSGFGLRLRAQVAAGAGAGRDPHLRRRLSAGAGSRRCRAPGTDATHRALRRRRPRSAISRCRVCADWLPPASCRQRPRPVRSNGR